MPPRSTQIPEGRPASQQGDPVNILSCEVSIKQLLTRHQVDVYSKIFHYF